MAARARRRTKAMAAGAHNPVAGEGGFRQAMGLTCPWERCQVFYPGGK